MRNGLTLIMVAGEDRARFIECRGQEFSEVECVERSSAAEDRAAYADRAGRIAARGGAHHALSPRHTPDERLRESFAADLALALEQRLAADPFDRLLVAASPKMLGSLREAFGPALTRLLAFDLDKDLLDVPARELPEYFTRRPAQ